MVLVDFVKAPEAQFRPIPLTIADLIAIFLPGLLWLLLLVTTYYVLWPDSPVHPASPSRVLAYFAARTTSNWLTGLAAIVLAALIGYGLKPLAMEATARLMSLPALEPALKALGRLHFQRHYAKMARRSIRFCDLRFPYDCLHEDEDYFKRLKAYFEARLGCTIEALPAHSVFTVVKRYLRLASPPMWEESERMEAEVRMSGVLLLAVLYSFLLSLVALLRYRSDLWELGAWCVASLLATIGLTLGFLHMRDMEVSYNYINCLLVLSQSTPSGPAEDAHAPHEEG